MWLFSDGEASSLGTIKGFAGKDTHRKGYFLTSLVYLSTDLANLVGENVFHSYLSVTGIVRLYHPRSFSEISQHSISFKSSAVDPKF